jgi:hypothetical protein
VLGLFQYDLKRIVFKASNHWVLNFIFLLSFRD